ncbi:MAG: hypothetical protein KOO60_12410 [Gemmatimonadales bacterium]|nr:hypothetical protein [Gemmatimonadales bacterium]
METSHKNRSQWGVVIAFAAAVTLLAVSAGSAPTWNGTIGEEDGWPVVNNPANPIHEDQVIRPEQLWRIGGDEEDTLFGLIEDALVDEAGNSYLLDSVLSTIYVVSRDGDITSTLGGEGDGPGEFRMGSEMVFLPNGAVGIMEMMPGKIVVLDRDGTPLPSFAMSEGGQGMMNHLQHISANDDAVLIGKVVTNFRDGEVVTRYSLSSHDADGTELAVLLENKEEQSGGQISLNMGDGKNAFTRNFSFCPDGRVVIFPEEKEYKLEIYDTAGVKQQLIRRKYESVRRSEKELEGMRKQQEQMRERFGGTVELEIDQYARDISAVIVRPDGEIWVANSQGDKDCPEQSIGLFDVYDQGGRYTRRVRIEADFDPDRDNFRLLDDRLFVFKEAQKAPPRTSTSGGGGMMVMMITTGGAQDEDEDEDEEIRPYEVICYKLPD